MFSTYLPTYAVSLDLGLSRPKFYVSLGGGRAADGRMSNSRFLCTYDTYIAICRRLLSSRAKLACMHAIKCPFLFVLFFRLLVHLMLSPSLIRCCGPGYPLPTPRTYRLLTAEAPPVFFMQAHFRARTTHTLSINLLLYRLDAIPFPFQVLLP